MTEFHALIAQTTQPAAVPPGGPARQPSIFETPFLPLLAAMIFLFWWMSRGQRKERKRYQEMLANLKKNDRVQTVGGILGTVLEVRDTDVVLKVDESSNVKIRFARNAIKEVLAEAARTDAAAELKK